MQADNVLTTAYLKKHPKDAARVLENLPCSMTADLFGNLSPDTYVEAFQYLIPSYAANTLGTLQEEHRGKLVNALPIEKLSSLLRFFDEEKRKNILAQLSSENRRKVAKLMQYPRDTVATIMSPPAFSLPNDISVAEALKRVKNSKRKYPSEIFLVDRNQKYTGSVTLDRMIKSASTRKLTSVADSTTPALYTRKSLTSLADAPAWSMFRTLPVTDSRGQFVGMLEYAALLHHSGLERPQEIARPAPSSSSPLEILFNTLAILLEGLVLKLFSPQGTKTITTTRNDNGK